MDLSGENGLTNFHRNTENNLIKTYKVQVKSKVISNNVKVKRNEMTIQVSKNFIRGNIGTAIRGKEKEVKKLAKTIKSKNNNIFDSSDKEDLISESTEGKKKKMNKYKNVR